MQGGNLVQVLANSLNPKMTHSSYQTLSNLKSSNGFAIQLLLISDDQNYDITIRQSALIHLKNLLQEHCQNSILPEHDIQTLKDSILQALIRNVTNSKLTPTFREIIYQMAEKYYPRQWSNIVEETIQILQNGTDLGSLFGAVQALKAIFSVFGASVSKQIELNNLSNKTMIPLLTLASKLFQNFNPETSHVLVSLFKLLNTAIMFHLPSMLKLNIHSLLIFLKKLLDLPADLSSQDNTNLYLLKRLSLRILFRLYQKYANKRMTQDKQFAHAFHSKYTRSFVETLILQIMLNTQGDKLGRKRSLELIKLSLACLAYINRQDGQAASMLIENRDSLLGICADKFRIPLNRSYNSFNDFKMYTEQHRVHMKQFFFSLISCQALPQLQSDSIQSLLSFLLTLLEKGTPQHQQLSLYLFTQMSTQLKYVSNTNNLDDKMTTMILNYVRPLLKENSHVLLKARACELISCYNYLEFPEEGVKDLAQLIYNCLLGGQPGDKDKEVYLKIYACHAFNSIMKYQTIAQFIKPFIPDILKIYTQLLKADSSIIKNFGDLLNLLQDQIGPYANDLIKLLVGMFGGYTQSGQQPQSQNYTQREENNQGEDDDDDCSSEDDEDPNNEQNARACISSIREILQSNSTNLNHNTMQILFDLILWVFSDPQQNYIEEGYNVLNLLLHKMELIQDQKYYLFFRVIAYAILGLPQSYIDQVRQKGDQRSLNYASLLQNICLQPDTDIIQNSIGCLRNFIAKSSSDYLRNTKDQFNFSYMDYILKVVKSVHQNQKSSQTDRLIIMTLYITLIEYQRVNEKELEEIITSVTSWMQMEHQNVESQQSSLNNNGFKTFGKAQVKYIYSPIYLQILLLSINFYSKQALQYFNPVPVLFKVISLQSSFKCDYQLSRIIVGFTYILDNQIIGDENALRQMLGLLPQLVRRLCNIRQEGDNQENDMDLDDEAEEEKVFGDDENTHIMGAVSPKDMMLGGGQNSDQEDDDWEEQFNKFYLSPLDGIEELKYLQDVLSKQAHVYGQFMSQKQQEQLSLYLTNAPPKHQ